MDTQDSIVPEFSFAFKRRSHSPSPHDCLAPASLHRPPSTDGSQSPPPLSDAPSSHGSPKDWNPMSWNATFPLAAASHPSPPLGWQWPQKHPNSVFLPAVDPMALTLTDPLALPPEAAYFNTSLLPAFEAHPNTSYSFLDALHSLPIPPLQSLSSLPLQTVAGGQPQSSGQEPGLGSLSVGPDNDAILAAIVAAGVHTATVDPNSRDILSTVPVRSPTPPPPKPDLTACPPLAKHVQPATRSTSAAASSGTSSDSRPDSPTTLESEPKVTFGASGRPKTSHTTIERRYRTNLNARILALRRAVPALRILEKDEHQNPMFPEDLIDERGFVDGVRAARKASKASILGKAAEYIHVLKKREIRLRHESSGLRLLIGSLVGGQALLREFDRTWKDRYGGEEMDESVDSSEGEEDDCSDDDEDKPRKKAKITNTKSTTLKKDKKITESPSEVGKRKRGRPKKVQSTGDPSPLLSSGPSPQQASSPNSPPQQAEPSHSFGTQYLLGAFLFFSCFQSTGDSQLRYQHESHSGSVINPPSPTFAHRIGSAAGARIPHLSLVMLFMALLMLLRWVRPSIGRSPPLKATTSLIEDPRTTEALAEFDDTNTIKAVKSLRQTLGITGIIPELRQWTIFNDQITSTEVDSAAKVRAFLRLVNLELVNSVLHGTRSRLDTLLALSRCLPRSPTSMISFAMLLQNSSSVLSQRYWSLARHMVATNPQYTEESIEAVALKMPVQDAHSLLVQGIRQGVMDVRTETASVETIVTVLILEAFQGLAKAELLNIVDRMVAHSGEWVGQHGDEEIEEAMTFVSETAGIVGGPCEHLLRLWKGGFHSLPAWCHSSLASLGGAAADTRDLVKAVALLREIKDVGLLTPTSSTSSLQEVPVSSLGHSYSVAPGCARQRSLSKRLLLRQLLAAPVFESEDALEDARDSIIDLLYEDRR